ncbi:MAG: heme-binding protein [Deltaproteobacteria bacterium]|nr:heme-binding protein [Deltaproteobacteria bacterium]
MKKELLFRGFVVTALLLTPHLVGAAQGLSLTQAKAMIEASEKKATEIKKPMNIAVVDEGGNLLAFARMDNSILVSIQISIDKAWTAAALKLPTAALTPLSQPGQPLFGIHTTNQGRVVIFGGGLPIQMGEQVVGGLGVSGGSVEQDMQVAEAGLAAFGKAK